MGADSAVIKRSIEHLSRSVGAVSIQLAADLQNKSADLAASLLWAHGELERLSGEAESMAGDVLEIESGKVGES